MLTCKEVSELVSQSLDRKLSLRERLGVRVHLLVCNACDRFAAQMRFLRAAARRFRELPPEDDTGVRLSDAARGRIRRRLDGQR
jgi:predicted anti-sigma-YlaC factor YlaD